MVSKVPYAKLFWMMSPFDVHKMKISKTNQQNCHKNVNQSETDSCMQVEIKYTCCYY